MKNGYKIKNKKTKNINFKTYTKKQAVHYMNCYNNQKQSSKGLIALGRLAIEKITKYDIKKGIWKQMPF